MAFGSGIPTYLADLAIRSLCVAAVAWVILCLLRVRSAAGRHSVWTVVTAGMLLLPALGPRFPSIPLRVLRPTPVVPSVARRAPAAWPQKVERVPQRPVPPPAPARPFTWNQAAAAIYATGLLLFLSRLAFSYAFTRRLLRASRPVDLKHETAACESTWIAVPVTVGFLNPKILLPVGWREWPADRLAAVMAHEQMHVRRADWAVAVLAGVNRCVFWFHPLAWWLERRLMTLAEQACDDAAILALGSRESYAQALLDMAAAVKTGQGRMVWEAMAMARTAEVRKRIELILDETRQIPRGLKRSQWATLLACSVPLLYLLSAAQLAPAQQAGLTSQIQPIVSTPFRSAPRLIRNMPEFAESLREPRYPGIVALSLTIGADGTARDIRVVKSLNPGLDVKAVEAVRHWKFAPAYEEDNPVDYPTTLEVTFRLPANAPPSQAFASQAEPAAVQSSFRSNLTDPGLTAPVLVFKVEPEYSEEARTAKYQGAITLSIVVGPDGIVHNIRVTRSLGLGLDQQAMEAVKHWIFKPAYQNGAPIEYSGTVTTSFRLW